MAGQASRAPLNAGLRYNTRVMASKAQPEDQRPVPQLYLVTPPVQDAEAFGRDLKSALGAAQVAAVLLRLAPGGESELVGRIKLLAFIAEQGGAALILDGNVDLVGRAGADGAHLIGINALDDAIGRLKPDRIAGAGGLTTRHDAMLAAEADADYVLFGEPDLNGERPSLSAIEERVSWWAEVFQPPCVAYAASLDEVGALAAAGADFVAVTDFIWNDPRGPAVVVADAAQRLKQTEAAK
jgi:thiamine-phosphate pyrophosphorylase